MATAFPTPKLPHDGSAKSEAIGPRLEQFEIGFGSYYKKST